MTRQEREAMNELSLQAYGKKGAWQKMIRKGEYKPETQLSANGTAMNVKRHHQINVDDVTERMKKVISDREEAAKKAAEEAALKAKGEENGTEQKANTEQGESTNSEIAAATNG